MALQWLTAVAVLRELAPALTEPRRHASAAALVAAFLLTVACVRNLQRFRTRGDASHDGFRPRSAALPTSAAVEEAQWAVPTGTPPRPAPLKEVQLREVAWVLSPGSPVGSFAPAAAQAHESILHAEDGACAKWCAACDAWVRLPAAHCAACGRCTRLRSGHSHRLRVCVGADNRRRYCQLVAGALLLQLCYLCLAAAHLLEAPEAAPLRRALRAAAHAWADSGSSSSGSQWRVPQLALSSAELLPCAPAVALLALGAPMLPSYHPSSALAVALLALGAPSCVELLGLQPGYISYGVVRLPVYRLPRVWVAGAPGCVDLAGCAVREVLFSCLVAAAAGSPAQVHVQLGVGAGAVAMVVVAAAAAAAAAAAVVALAPSLTTTLTRRSTSATCAAVPTADSACSRPAAPLVGLRSELRCCACAAVRAAQR